MIHQAGSGLDHPAGTARGTGAATFADTCYEALVTARVALIVVTVDAVELWQ
jgi:hypothetical protein